MLEIFNHILGIFINIFLICKVVARPLLWSTINTFFCSLFCLNAVHLLLQLFLIIIETREGGCFIASTGLLVYGHQEIQNLLCPVPGRLHLQTLNPEYLGGCPYDQVLTD